MITVDNDTTKVAGSTGMTKVADSQYKNHNATIKSVAALAGVSTATVSRVMNNRGYLSDEVKQKVSEAMKELNYQPNDLARSLHLQKSSILGLIVPSVAHPFFSQVTQNVEVYAHSKGYRLLICNSLGNKAIEKEYIYYLKRSQVEGIILGSHLLDVSEYLEMDIPMCSLDRQLGDSIPYVCCDNYKGGVLATRHLISQGCKKLLHVSSCLNTPLLSNRRTDAFIDVCRETGIDYVCYELPDSSNTYLSKSEFLRSVLEKNPDCDGAFVTSDFAAVNLLFLAFSMNRRVPDDFKIVGFDGTILSSLIYPSLTTVKQPIDEICSCAVEYLIRQINGESVPNSTMMAVTLIEGGSSGWGQGRSL